MRKVKGLALCQIRLDLVPKLGLCRIRQQVHDNRALLTGLVDLKEGLVRDPSLRDGLIPGGAFTASDDDVELVVAKVEGLTSALGPVAEDGEGVVLEGFLEFCGWVITSFVDDLFCASKVDCLHPALL